MQVCLLREPEEERRSGEELSCVYEASSLLLPAAPFCSFGGPPGREEDVQENRAGPRSSGERQHPGHSVGFGAVSDRFLLEWSAWGSRRAGHGAQGEHL